MRAGTRVFGIPVGVHPSWTVIALLVGGAFYLAALGLGDGVAVSLAIACGGTVLLGVGVLAHELSHGVVARMRGIPVRRVILFAFGGYSELESEPEHPMDELIVAGAGPIGSLILAAALFGFGTLLPDSWRGADAVIRMLALVNLGVALFNLLPGLPLDGGRVLRAWLRRRRSSAAATVVAARTGRALAAVLVLAGPAFAAAGWPVALWNVPVGIFLYRLAAEAERDAGPDTLVAEVMEPPGSPVTADVPVAGGDRYVPVVEGGVVVGILPPSTSTSTSTSTVPAGEAMIVLRPADLLDAEARLTDVVARLRRRRRPGVVVAGRRMVGVLPLRTASEALEARR